MEGNIFRVFICSSIANPMTPTQLSKNKTYSREMLFSNRTYYIRTDGNNSNNGLSNTSGGAFLTLQGALDNISDSIDANGYNVIVQMADGTYAGGCILPNIVGSNMGNSFYIKGNSSTPSNVIVSSTGDAFYSFSITTVWQISDMKITTSTSGHCISVSKATLYFANINFGTCASSYNHINVATGGYAVATANYAITGGANCHFCTSGSGSILATWSRTITITGVISFVYFSLASQCGVQLVYSMTFTSGTITGARYSCSSNAVIHTSGGGASYFPGNSAGSTSTGGIYT